MFEEQEETVESLQVEISQIDEQIDMLNRRKDDAIKAMDALITVKVDQRSQAERYQELLRVRKAHKKELVAQGVDTRSPLDRARGSMRRQVRKL